MANFRQYKVKVGRKTYQVAKNLETGQVFWGNIGGKREVNKLVKVLKTKGIIKR
jgi:hypothetical protein